jgi:hypothetical protein
MILTLLALRVLGRRIPQSATFLLGGIVLLLNLAVSTGIYCVANFKLAFTKMMCKIFVIFYNIQGLPM